ncbi:MAG TPA: hypothetical protein PLG27_09460, partial [Candidatus Latescibacteria bacterium]|nr:hypothetical protein [Candidatus Latescibacterota bacterium]
DMCTGKHATVAGETPESGMSIVSRLENSPVTSVNNPPPTADFVLEQASNNSEATAASRIVSTGKDCERRNFMRG